MICLGTMNFGTTLGQDQALRILDRFTEAGGTRIDTANCYASWLGNGDESELMIGAWLRSRRARDRIRLASKVGARPPVSGDADFEGLSAETVRNAVEQSLRRLGTDHLDVCFAHLIDDSVPIEETLGAFEELVTAGKVLEVGLSNQTLDSVRRARSVADERAWTPATWLQQRHSYLQPLPGASFGAQAVLTEGLAGYAATVPDLIVQGYSPLLSGAYTRPDRQFFPHYQHPENEIRLAALTKVAGDLGRSKSQVVLAWMLASKPSVQPVIGVSRLDQLEDCLAATRLSLSAEHLSCLALNS